MRIYRDTRKSKSEAWYIDYSHQRTRYRYRAGSSEHEAETLRHRVEYEIRSGQHQPEKLIAELRGIGGNGLTFGKLVVEFLSSYRSRSGNVKYFQERATVLTRYLGENTPVSEIGPKRVEAFRNARLEELRLMHTRNHLLASERELRQAGCSTTRKELVVLSMIFNWGLDQKVVSENPAGHRKVKRPSEPEGKKILLTDEHVELAAEHSHPSVRLLILWLDQTGMRLSEATKLGRADLDTSTGWVFVEPGKTGIGRRVPYTDELHRIIEDGKKHRDSDPVFPGPDGKRMNPKWAAKHIKIAMVRAGVPEASAHSLRHAFCTRAATAGVPMDAIGGIVGQGAASVTQRYLHCQDDRLRQAMAKVTSIRGSRLAANRAKAS